MTVIMDNTKATFFSLLTNLLMRARLNAMSVTTKNNNRDGVYPLVATAVIAAFAGLIFSFLFDVLLSWSLRIYTQNVQSDMKSFVLSLLLVSSLVYLLMILAISISGLVALISMRFLKISHAGKTVLLAIPVLCITWYWIIREGYTKEISLWILTVLSFVLVYVGSLLMFTIITKTIKTRKLS